VAEVYLRASTAKWAEPTEEFVKRAEAVLENFIKKSIIARCEHLSYGGLYNHLLCGPTSI